MKVQVVSKKLIKPSSPTPNHVSSINTSFVDQITPPVFVSILLHYREPGDTIEAISLLEKSLSEILINFFPLAGRYNDDGHLVNCNDLGAEYWVARVDGKLSKILDEDFDTKILTTLVPNLIGLETNPLVAIQINVFSCGGLAIGICLSHRVADGYSTAMFIDQWSKLCFGRGSLGREISPSFELGNWFPRRDLSMLKPPKYIAGDFNVVTKRFVFDAETISNLKNMAKECSVSPTRQVTRVEVVTVVIWKALIETSQATHGQFKPSLLTHSMNLRPKLDEPHPDNYFGNLYNMVITKFKGGDSKAGFGDLLLLLMDALDKAKGLSISDVDDDLFDMVVNPYMELHKALWEKNIDVHMFTSLCRFPFYEADFGWGKPNWVSGIEQLTPMVALMDAKNEDGIEAWVCLDKQDMFHFQHKLSLHSYKLIA